MSVNALGSSLLGWPIWASIGAHGVALAAASTVVTLGPPATPPAPVPIEVVRLEAPAPPPPRAEPPKLAKPVGREPIAPPRLVTEPAKAIEQTPVTSALLQDAPRRESAAPLEAPVDTGQRFLAGASSSSTFTMPGPSAGNSSGAGALFSTGDLPIAGRPGGAGKGSGGGGEGPGPDGAQVASKGTADGLTSFARPVGGYQTRPRYPDSARRQGIEGETLLRFQVLPTGRVVSVAVVRSAGHPDLDRSAVEAVQTWRFEPARRGKEAVAVWVTLPVRFQLQSGVGD